MSVEPPRTEGTRNTGLLLVLGLVSVVLLAIVAVFGMLAFGIEVPGTGMDEPELADPSAALVTSGFTVMSSTTESDAAAVEVEFTVRNTGDTPVDDHQVLVQCDDGGYVSAITPVPALQPDDETTLRMQLIGTGDPACEEPDISFSPRQEND